MPSWIKEIILKWSQTEPKQLQKPQHHKTRVCVNVHSPYKVRVLLISAIDCICHFMCFSQNVDKRFGVFITQKEALKGDNMDESAEQFIALDNSQWCELFQAENAWMPGYWVFQFISSRNTSIPTGNRKFDRWRQVIQAPMRTLSILLFHP